MKKPVTFIYQYIQGRIMTYHIQHDGGDYYQGKLKNYNHKAILSLQETTDYLKEKILSSTPFMVCRFGATELATLKTFDFQNTRKYKVQLERIHILSGVFPETEDTGMKFSRLMLESIPCADLVGIWPQPFEEYYLKEYGSTTLETTWLKSLNPWMNPQDPWSSALKGKKVLIVHPFEESIRRQYQRREKIFPGTEILPEFTLDTLKSVQTSGGGEDERFKTWFEAYEWMRKEILNRDFDVAILGCGAYGFPLAADIKNAGKQAIHFGGATQLLFGIMGNRWNNNPLIQSLVNESWVRPLESEKPKNSAGVENNCYW